MTTQSQELKALRCTKCGAPLPAQVAEEEYIKCEYCGYTQKLIDTRDYLDKLRGEIYNWVKTIVPPSVIISQTVDPIARHNIFVFNIKPKILGDFTSVKSKLATQLTHPLFILPFYKLAASKFEEPKKCFENSVRVQSLEPMAIVDEDKSFLDDVISTFETYAYVNNAFELFLNNSDLSYLIKNFEQATVCLEKLPNKVVEYKRMQGTTEAYRALDSFIKGDLRSAKNFASTAIKLLEEVQKEAGKSSTTAVMIPATTIDISTLKTLDNLIEIGLDLFESGKPPTEILPYLQKYFKIAEEARMKKDKDTKIYEELSMYLKKIVASKSGAEQIEMLPGDGNILFPFWVVSVTYTFATGALLWKKGREAEDKILIAATVPLASQPVTDVFSSTAGIMDRLAGKETTLTTGFISTLLTQVRKTSVPSKINVIPPLLSKVESEQVAENYLSYVSQRFGGKIKFGAAQSQNLIYAMAEVKDGDIYIPALGNSQVKIAPHFQQLMEIAF
jgi:hypothetical protein